MDVLLPLEKVFTAASSPVIGSPRTAFVNVTSKIANGEVSFFGNPVSLNVNEPPDGRVSNISLLVMRDGVSGSATVSWRISPVSSTFTSRDVSPWHGIIYFGHGMSSATYNVIRILMKRHLSLFETIIFLTTTTTTATTTTASFVSSPMPLLSSFFAAIVFDC